MQVGILGIGVYLPENVRRNDWWPRDIVAIWEEKLSLRGQGSRTRADLPPGADKVLAAMADYRNDPFKGCKERRVMPSNMVPSDMEIAAAREALERAHLDREKINLLLTYSQLPDFVGIPTAPAVHQGLRLCEPCLSFAVDGACNSFQHQLAIAESMIKSGRAQYALLVQSAAVQHIERPEDEISAWFGDGAAAVVLGPVSEGRGILATAHITDGSLYKALVNGSPDGRRWFDAGTVVGYVADREAAVRLALSLPVVGKAVVDRALQQAGHSPEQVDFYASHQGTHWFRRVTQEHIGLINARSFDSYEFTASLSSANIPFCMAMAERNGLLREGDLVATYSGGSGITAGASIMRWGT